MKGLKLRAGAWEGGTRQFLEAASAWRRTSLNFVDSVVACYNREYPYSTIRLVPILFSGMMMYRLV